MPEHRLALNCAPKRVDPKFSITYVDHHTIPRAQTKLSAKLGWDYQPAIFANFGALCSHGAVLVMVHETL
jgi:hypothetical protein